MSYLPSLPHSLGALAVEFANARHGGSARRDLGSLICKIADCITAIAENVYAGKHSTERCAELTTYIANIHSLIAKEIDTRVADKLTFWLNYVDEAPGFVKIEIERSVKTEVSPGWFEGVAARFARSEDLKTIAGTIRAFGNLLQVPAPADP